MDQILTLAHSPDADDAFMFYALAKERVATGGLRFQHVLADIETLNQSALRSVYDVTAISFHAYAYLHQSYALLRCGSSFGEGYGPLVVAREALKPAELTGKRIAIPGKMTSAYLLLRLFAGEVETVAVPFDQIPQALASGQAGAGLLIHEGQLTYGESGLRPVVDLGAWWQEQHGLPVPLGGLAVRRGIEPERVRAIAAAVEASIRFALEHRADALAHALQYGRGMSTELGDRFVGMYVNELTLDAGARGQRSIQLLLDRAFEARLIPARVVVELHPA
ncbi:MAG: menaquinone biosynthesis family protein [Candidatus Acidiferrales bacterium]